MAGKLMPNKQPAFFTPNAPIKYAMAGGRGVMLGCGFMTALYAVSYTHLDVSKRQE